MLTEEEEGVAVTGGIFSAWLWLVLFQGKGGIAMDQHHVKRFTWTKDEVFRLLLADLESRGIEVEGESALRFNDMVAILEVWPPKMLQDETFPQSEG